MGSSSAQRCHQVIPRAAKSEADGSFHSVGNAPRVDGKTDSNVARRAGVTHAVKRLNSGRVRYSSPSRSISRQAGWGRSPTPAIRSGPQSLERSAPHQRRFIRCFGEVTGFGLHFPQKSVSSDASVLRCGAPTVLAVLTALAVLTVMLMFRHLPQGFTNSHLRQTTARLLTRSAPDPKPGLMTSWGMRWSAREKFANKFSIRGATT